MKKTSIFLAGLAALSASACTTTPGPVEVTRFVAPDATNQLGEGTIFVTGAPGQDADSLALAPYKNAVAAELAALGYTKGAMAEAGQIAYVNVERYVLTAEGRRSPVSVGVGGSTGTYGSGVGLGIGINLGGGERDKVGTKLSVSIRDSVSGETLWEGRADFRTNDNSPLAQSQANAQTLAAALFSEFPGANGETTEVEVIE